MKKGILLLLCLMGHVSAQAMSLMDVYRQALKNDQAYLGAKATWDAAQQSLPIARASLLPALTLAAYYHRFYASEAGEHVSNHNFNYSASLSQSVFDWSAWKALDEASYGVKAARAMLAQAAQEVMVTTISDYFTVLEALEQTEVSKQTLAYYQQSYTQIKEKYKVGMATTADLYAAQSALDLQSAALLSAGHAVDVAMEDLSVLTGKRYKTLQSMESIKLTTPVPNDINAWTKQATQDNYALKSALFSAEAAKEAIEVARSARMPSVTMTGSFSRTSQNPTSPTFGTVGLNYAAPVNESLLSLNANFPVYQGGGVAASTKQAYFNYQTAMASYQGLRRQTVADTRKYYLNVLYNIRAVKANRLAVTSAESALEATEEAYKAGTDTLSDVFEAVKDVANAKQGLITTRYDYLLNVALLQQSVGTLKAADVDRLSSLLNHPVTLTNKKDTHEPKKPKTPS